MDKIYLYKTANKSVAYDEEHWYIDNNPQQQNDGDGISQFKEYAVSEAYRLIACDISKYTCHFKNIAVLTAAGTSMENGAAGILNEVLVSRGRLHRQAENGRT